MTSEPLHIGAGLLMGLLGSLHCLGMCGPLALALPAAPGSRARFVAGRILYNLGRTATYALLGVAFGLFGRVFALAGWQRGLSIAAGVLMLLAAIGYRTAAGAAVAGGFARALGGLKRALSALLQRRTAGALLLIGLLNGLLPCGLVYAALAGAAATGGPLGGALFMAAFGLGTIPAMLAVSLAGRLITAPWRARFQRAVPVAMAVLAVLFIVRGLSLGIPYLSPDLSPEAVAGGRSCCH